MRVQHAFGLCVIALWLAGCGGGGGSNANTTPLPPIVTPSPGPATYSGTLSEVDANDAISTAPVSTTTTANAAVVVSSAPATDGTTNVVFTAKETDTSALTTLTSVTVSTLAYQTQSSGSVDVRALKTVATESSGVIYEHDFGPNNGLLAVTPLATGSFVNDAAEEYKETDPGIGVGTGGTQPVTTDRIVAANGSYTANIVNNNTTTGVPATDTVTENANFSANYALNSLDPGKYTIAYTAPVNSQIVVTRSDPNFLLLAIATVPSWIPAALTQPSVETDTVTAAAPLDSSCSANSSFSGTAALVLQQRTIADAVDGTLETRTTKSYETAAAGTVCVVIADTIDSFYDYSLQEGDHTIFFANSATVPLLVTTLSETLGLQSAVGKQVAAATRLPSTLIAARLAHLARTRAAAQMALLRKTAAGSLRGGSAK